MDSDLGKEDFPRADEPKPASDARPPETNISNPYTQITESKKILQKLSSVHIIKKQMVFSDAEIEARFVESIEATQRSRFFVFGLAAFAFSLYTLLYFNKSNKSIKEQFRMDSRAHTSTILFKLGCVLVMLLACIATFVAYRQGMLRGKLERFIQYLVILGSVLMIFLMDPWRLTVLVYGREDAPIALPFLFKSVSAMTTNTGTVMLLGGGVMYLAFVLNMRFRRLIWICIALLFTFALAVMFFQVPTCDPDLRDPDIMRCKSPDESKRHFNVYTPMQLLGLFLVGIFGKVELEMLQRRTFLELELAQRRIEVLHKTIDAIGQDDHTGHQTREVQERLRSAERAAEKLRLTSNSDSSVTELTGIIETLRATGRTMTILEFQREVLLGPIKTGIEVREPRMMHWIHNTKESSDASSKTLISTVVPGPIIDTELGLSAKSLMRRVGMEWELNPSDLEKTLKANRATSLSAFGIVSRAVLSPYLSNLLKGISLETLDHFISVVNQGYLNVPFHNADRGALVIHHSAFLANMTGVAKFVTAIDRLALNIASLCVHVSHFGRNNTFLVESRHELAIKYNDSSVLSNFHASKTIDIIQSSNVVSVLVGKDLRKFRSRVIQLILACDPSHQFSQLSELQLRLMGPDFFSESELVEADRKIALEAVMRAAEMGHHAMPFEIHAEWASRLATELALQGDDEVRLGLEVSPMCDRSTQDVPKMMSSIIEVLVYPFMDQVCSLAESVNSAGENVEKSCGIIRRNLSQNLSRWKRSDSGDDLFIPIPDKTRSGNSLIHAHMDKGKVSSEDEKLPLLDSGDSDNGDEGPRLVSYSEIKKL